MAGNYIVSSYNDPLTGQPKYRVVGTNGEDAGSAVAILTNKDVADQLAQKSVITTQDTQQAQRQDINYQGGVDASPSSISSTANPQVPALQPGEVKVYNDTTATITTGTPTTKLAEGQVTVYGDTGPSDGYPTTKLAEGQVKVYGDTGPSDGYPTTTKSEQTTPAVENTSTTGISYTTIKDIDYNRNSDGTFSGSDGQTYISQGDGFVLASAATDNTAAPVDPAVNPETGAGVDTAVPTADIQTAPAPVNSGPTRQVFDDGSILYTNADGSVTSQNAPAENLGTGTSSDSADALSGIKGKVQNAQQQQTIANQRKQINDGDWRVRLRLAPQSNYLYNNTGPGGPGILAPLKVTDGIIFPYTPAISTSYRANYSNYDLTHSNYRGYFYQNSYVDAINLTAMFTAQDTNDANYLLAVIHFFRSVTKMFYGQDSQRGSPPPVVYLSGLGDYQFREHACLVSSFQYNLPADVDYIRAGSPNNAGLNFNNIRDRQSVATNSIFGSLNRLAAAFLTKGAINQGTAAASPPTLGLTRPTYVPTKMEIQLQLLPVQSRQQVSQQFSLQGFATGDLLKKGFW